MTGMAQASILSLSDATLEQLPQGIDRPCYDRSSLQPGIVHIGLGNFHRAHQAWYLHRLMQEGEALDWAIIGAGVRAYDADMRKRLLAQDCLTTLVELDPTGTAAEVTGAMIDYLPIEEGNGSLVSAMADPRIRIVSLTVTEGGYYRDPATGGFEARHADIAHDAAQPLRPRTAFGAIVAALRMRRDAGHGPFTLQSCDNLQGNGAILRDTVLCLARLGDQDMANWIEAHCSFPDSMVDCIVPATGERELALTRALGIDDAAPVTHENFRQWVIEDDFCAGRPAWDRVGATMTHNVSDYESMKIRMLNAGHQLLANAGEVIGLEMISECLVHKGIASFFRKVEREEIAPHVDPVPNMAPEAYAALIENRFANPAIRDTVRRVAFDGSSRHTGFLLPVLRDAIAAGGAIEGLSLAEALWARMCEGTREDGSEIAPNDPFWADLNQAAHAARQEPSRWLLQKQFYGDLAQHAGFSETFAHWLDLIWSEGVEVALLRYARGS